MNKWELKENTEKRFSSKARRKIVEELRSGMLTIRQSTKQYQVSVSMLQDWNRWYYKTRLLKYFKPKPSLFMEPTRITVEQLTQQLAAAQAELAQEKLKTTALETMITVTEKQLKIEIRKKYGSKQSRS